MAAVSRFLASGKFVSRSPRLCMQDPEPFSSVDASKGHSQTVHGSEQSILQYVQALIGARPDPSVSIGDCGLGESGSHLLCLIAFTTKLCLDFGSDAPNC